MENGKVFVEITTTNENGENKKALVRVADIVGIKELHVEGVKLYNENGDLVSETPATTRDFQVLVVNPCGSKLTLYVGESEYLRLVQILTA